MRLAFLFIFVYNTKFRCLISYVLRWVFNLCSVMNFYWFGFCEGLWWWWVGCKFSSSGGFSVVLGCDFGFYCGSMVVESCWGCGCWEKEKNKKMSIYKGSIWIELILLKLKTKNWKYCNKIIFKYVNSIVRPIFNKKVTKKWSL